MNKPLVLLGSLVLACSSLGAQAQTPPPGAPAPAPGEPVPVPGTGDLILSPNAAIADRVFAAELSGLAEIPPRQTDATGTVAVTLNEDGNSLHYRLAVDNIDNVSAAHLHLGQSDENGPIVVPLLGTGAPGNAANPPSGPASGVIAEGDISVANLTGPLTGTPLVVLMELIRSGAIYANVHTSDFPGGEIRGQLKGFGADAAAACQLLQDADGGTGTGDDTGANGGAGGGDDTGDTAGGSPTYPGVTG